MTGDSKTALTNLCIHWFSHSSVQYGFIMLHKGGII